MSRSKQLTDLQLAVMRVLWSRSEATVSDVQEALRNERDLATTTVATLLKRLERRGLVAHRRDGRQFVYRPVVTEAEVCRNMVSDLADRLFAGDVAALVSHLLSAREIAPGDLARVRALIEEREREQ